MRIKNIFLIVFCWLTFQGCAPYSAEDLVGQWNAIAITEKGDSLKVDVNEVKFEFLINGTYQYQSTLDFKEAGYFRVDGPHLFTTDTLQQFKTEKAVEIARLENDTLEILMNEAGKERRMVILRVE